MVVRVGINGFGRVGRVVFRKCFQHPEVEVAAINDPAVEIDYICYLIKFDSTHGKLDVNISHKGSEIYIDGRVVKVFHFKQPASTPWFTANVHYVVEASGMFSTLEKASGHLSHDGVKRVILTAPSVDIPMLVLGVNADAITPAMKVLSCGSSTLYCLAPIIKLLTDTAGLEDGFVTSIHAMTPSLKPLDGLCLRGKHWRENRSITQNIIPAVTGACKALGRIVPSARDKMSGLAFRVPIANVSVLDITVRLTKNTSLAAIFQSVEKASKTTMKDIIKTSNEENVSSDFIGDTHSCILDATSSLQLKPDFFKLVCWYENEYSYACRVIETILFSEKQLNQLILITKPTYYVRPIYKKQDMPQQTDPEMQRRDEIKRMELMNRVCPEIFPLKKSYDLASQLKHKEQFKTNILCDDNAKCNAKYISKKCSALCTTDQNPATVDPVCGKTVTRIDSSKAQERLDKVKREFYKMVDMTEGLIKISNNSKYKLSTSSRDISAEASPNDIKTNTANQNPSTTATVILQKDKTFLLSAPLGTSGGNKSTNTAYSRSAGYLSKEQIVDLASYQRESNNSVNEIKKLFENSQYMLKVRCQHRTESSEKEDAVKQMLNSIDPRHSSSSQTDLDSRQKNFFISNNNYVNKKDETVKPFIIDKLSGNDQVTKSIIPEKMLQNYRAQIKTETNMLTNDIKINQIHTQKQPTNTLPNAKDNQIISKSDNVLVSPLSIGSKKQNINTEYKEDTRFSESTFIVDQKSSAVTQPGITLPNAKYSQIIGKSDKVPVGLLSIDSKTQKNRNTEYKEDTKFSESTFIVENKPPAVNLIKSNEREFREDKVQKIQSSSQTVLHIHKNISNQHIEQGMIQNKSSNLIQMVDCENCDKGLPINKNDNSHVFKTLIGSASDGLSKKKQLLSGTIHVEMALEDKPNAHVVNKNNLPTLTQIRNVVKDSFNKSQKKINLLDINSCKSKRANTMPTEPHNVVQENKKERFFGSYADLKSVLTLDKKNEKKSKPSLCDVISEVAEDGISEGRHAKEDFDVNEGSYAKEGIVTESCIKSVDENVPTKPATDVPRPCMNDDNDSATQDNVNCKLVPKGDAPKKVDCMNDCNANDSVTQDNVNCKIVPQGDAPKKVDCMNDCNANDSVTQDDVDCQLVPKGHASKTHDHKHSVLNVNTKYTISKLKLNKSNVWSSEKCLDISSNLEKFTVIDEELKKRNVKLVPETNNLESSKGTVNHKERKYKLVGRYLKDIDSYNRCTSIPSPEQARAASSKCSSSLGSCAERSNKQDIYDKLDSDSASDSGNSIDRRKSQVITIKDLTSSLEDIERLDKICRIIEISDDLSDRLFSNLDDEAKLKAKQKWSFRDLCEKIKLDEFCTTIFGK